MLLVRTQIYAPFNPRVTVIHKDRSVYKLTPPGPTIALERASQGKVQEKAFEPTGRRRSSPEADKQGEYDNT